MLNIKIKNTVENKFDSIIFFLENGFKLSKELISYYPNLKKLLDERNFKGNLGEKVIVPIEQNKKIVSLIIIGLGKKQEKFINVENFRKAIGSLPKLSKYYNFESSNIFLPDYKLFGVEKKYLFKQAAIILNMASYEFDEFITKPKNKSKKIKEIVIVSNEKSLEKIINEAKIISDAVNTARHCIDLPANMMSPEEFVTEAKKIAKDSDLKITVFDEAKIKKLGMGGLAGVAQGSERDAKFVILEYKGLKNSPTLGFVGKGITFDSGGLSLKPSSGMETMKEDMSGAAAVLGAMKAIGKLKPKVNVIGFMPLTDNLPGHSPLMPGDIIRFYNGKTAEILNTDAEGRLILADALSYAVKNYKLDSLVDLATLTGACQHALGPFFSGLFSNHENLINKLNKAAEISGDNLWRLPLTDDYKAAIKSNVADIRNTGKPGYYSGATTASLFLQNFVGDTPWAHLDIAGTAFHVPDKNYLGSGATGVGVRLLLELAENYK